MRLFITLWNLSGKARRTVLAGVVLRLLQALLLGVAFGCAMSVIIAILSYQPITSSHATWISVLCALSLILQLLVGWQAARCSWLAAYEAVANMRLALLRHLRVIPINALGKRTRGDIAALVSTDLQLIEDFLSEGLPRLGQALGIPLLVIVAVALNDPVLAATIALPIGCVIPVMVWSSKRLSELGDRRQEAQAQASARMIDLIASMPALRMYAKRRRVLCWYHKAVEEFRAISVEMVHKLIVPVSAAGLVLMLGVPLVVAVSGYAFVHSGTQVALIGAVLVIVLNVYQPVNGLLATNESWQMAQAALRRVQALMQVDALPDPQAPSPKPKTNDVEFSSVSYTYPDGTVGLHSVSLTARHGQMTAIVGPSGAGKSTILNLIARFDDVSEGQILIGGVDIRDIPAQQRSELVTVVFQDVHLFPGTIAENIAMGSKDVSRAEIIAAARLACADEFIRELPAGYDTVLGEDGAGLSGGQRQRLSIARAALKDAPIVLLDEATSALDPLNEAAVHRGLTALLEGRTTIIVAHKLRTIAKADCIYVLDKARIVQSGNHESLRSAPGLYAHLWETLERSTRWAL